MNYDDLKDSNEPPQYWGFMTPYTEKITKEDILHVIKGFKRMLRKSDSWQGWLDEDFGDGHAWMCLDALENMLKEN